MSTAAGLLVLGAGPAGIGAALAAAGCGVDTVILDEAPEAGGQIYRAPAPDLLVRDRKAMGPDFTIGAGLRQDLHASSVRTAFGQRVWFAAPGFELISAGAGGGREWQATAVVDASGTSERIIPVPGWTLPGVLGLAATTILLKAQHVLPGERTVVAGCGPLVAAVAAGILKGGGTVAAMVDLASPADWARAMPALAARPDLLMRGMGWLRQIRAAGVPMLFRHAVTRVIGVRAVAGVEVEPVDGAGRPRTDRSSLAFAADALALGHGLVPSTQLTRLLRARHRYDAARGGWHVVRDADGRTTVSGLYAAGDGAGLSGAAAALLQGRIAGLAAAHDLGRLSATAHAAAAAPLRRQLARADRFGAAMARMMAVRPGLLATITADTVVCRCEDVTRTSIDDAIGRGARTLNQLKASTRCGMGPCQGRMCGEAAAELLAARVGGREQAGQWSSRVPIRPVSLADMTGAFDYDDIRAAAPVPQPL